ncbi:DUF6779 domain-containing protein [Corynebacterium lujinxingii]|uniref:DUF6779 domain-containing protein n=1 Tax=Corynebacterium lujinxingii TaxID=2763010 RepID=A0A7H0JY42_9CORY|nr:DUF6779 domain-containing protein [Corynebacterium lujinxingii]MBC3178346.1 hypothetical protein [Corynebacterium lujinxingii]NNO10777.1 hypothetical protein [Corynebacterium lujinxingii]QNP89958.1 hypothetical protein IAU68_09920 [Corynebacterium lujinxingii]
MSAKNTSRDSANLWVIIPFVVAVIGTVVMLFTNSANALKVALIFALWAGAAGLILNFRNRRERDDATRDAEAAREQIREQEERHQATLAALPQGGEAPVDMEALRALQDEIQALREQLEELNGRVFEYEPAAVRASARRITEIERTPEPAPEPEPTRPSPSTDDTVVISRVRPTGAPSSDAIAGRIGTQPSSRAARNPLSDLISERTAQAEPEPTPEPEPQEEPRRSGRRRRDERNDSISVAELLARQGK